MSLPAEKAALRNSFAEIIARLEPARGPGDDVVDDLAPQCAESGPNAAQLCPCDLA